MQRFITENKRVLLCVGAAVLVCCAYFLGSATQPACPAGAPLLNEQQLLEDAIKQYR